MAVSGVLVVAGLAGADPRELSVFGVKPDGDWGVIVISATAILTQLYWYVLRYLHMREDAVVEREDNRPQGSSLPKKIKRTDTLVLRRKSGDLFSNWSCFLLTAFSWYFAGSWIGHAWFD